MKIEQLSELVYQALETEIGGVAVYQTALKCVQDEHLKEEWAKYLEQTRHHRPPISRARPYIVYGVGQPDEKIRGAHDTGTRRIQREQPIDFVGMDRRRPACTDSNADRSARIDASTPPNTTSSFLVNGRPRRTSFPSGRSPRMPARCGFAGVPAREQSA
jgi:hypothetical protein